MYETNINLTFQLGSDEFEAFGAVLEIDVRVYAEHDLSLHAEPCSFTFDGNTHYIRKNSACTNQLMVKFVEYVVAKEMTDEMLDMVRDSDDAFEGMPSQHDQWRLDERTY